MTAVLVSLLIMSVFVAGGVYCWHDLDELIAEQLEEERHERRLDVLWADDEREVAA